MYRKYLININSSIEQTLKLFSKYSTKTLIVVNNKEIMLGTISDGDIRKAILKKKKFDSSIASLINKKPKFIYSNLFKKDLAKNIFLKYKIETIPIINNEKKVLDIIFWSQIFSDKKPKQIIKEKVLGFIMAGGLGTRLEPFTDILPKPLLPVNDKPVIDHIINDLVSVGINNIFVSINYKAKIMKAYFDEKNYKNCKIKLLQEKKPLGTIGSLKFIKNYKRNIFVLNCDAILNIDMSDLIKFHYSKKSLITIVACNKNYQFPYGNIELSRNGQLSFMIEKPNFHFLANVGAYLINPNLLKIIPSNEKYDFNNFIDDLSKNNIPINVYPINDQDWKDVGQWSEFKEVIKNFK